MISLKTQAPKSGFVSPFVILRTLGLIFLFMILILNASPIHASACNPSAAQLCVALDDTAVVYLNGTLIDTFTYCDISWACTPKCIALSPAQMALLLDSGNVISVYDQNTNCCEVWASWSLDITCATGHAIISSDNRPVKLYYDTTCTNPNPSPTPQGAANWYDRIGYNDTGWGNPVDMTGKKYGRRIFDPSTGNLLAALSYAATMSTNCGALWFREGFDLTPEPTVAPPAFTISKTANPSTNIGQNSPWLITFTLHICNTGGGTFGNPVNIADQWNNAVDGWQYNWPYDITDPTFGWIKGSGSGTTATIQFADGFPGNSCYDYIYSVTMYSGQPTYCVNWNNIADLSYLAQPTKEANALLQDYCPPPPVFSLVKTANKTSGIVNGDSISFNMHICNTGGAAWDNSGNMKLVDDWTSNSDGWQYDGPYYTGNPATGISSISASNTGHVTTYTISLAPPGFTGCVDVPMNMHMTTRNPGNCAWINNASLTYFASPVLNSSVAMQDLCSPTFTATPTFTVTPTKTQTFTMTQTITYSPTKTISATPTLTQTSQPPSNTFTRTVTFTPTYTITPQPTMDITKTANVSAATFGDTITYTLTYHNTGSVTANPVCIYDTVPASITYIGSSNAPTTGAPDLAWCFGPVAPGGNGTITWWGRITSYPFNPLFDLRIYLGDILIIREEKIATYKSYIDSENLAFMPYVLRE